MWNSATRDLGTATDFQPLSTMTELLSLRCWVVGQPLDKAFTVEVSPSKDVSTLKDAIKKKQQHNLDRIDASDLDVWAVAIPLMDGEVDLEEAGKAAGGKALAGGKLLRTVKQFESLDEEQLHVVVRKPDGMSPLRSPDLH